MPYEAGNYQIQYRSPFAEDEEGGEVAVALTPTGQSRRLGLYGLGIGAGALLGAAGGAYRFKGGLVPALTGAAGGLLGAAGAYAVEGRRPLPVRARLMLPPQTSEMGAAEAASVARIAGFDLPDQVPSRRASFQLAYGYDPGEPVVTKVSVALICARRPGGFLDRLRAHSASLRAY